MTRCYAFYKIIERDCKTLDEENGEACWDRDKACLICKKSSPSVSNIINHMDIMDEYFSNWLDDELNFNKLNISEKVTTLIASLRKYHPKLVPKVIEATMQLAPEERTAKNVKELIWFYKQRGDQPAPEPRGEVVHDSIENVLDYLEPGKADLILTDPPYAKEHLPLWGLLAEKAAKLLKPGGFLIAYSGKEHLSAVLQTLSKHLKYLWTLAMLHTKTSRVFHLNLLDAWRPILLYVKPPHTPQPTWVNDVLKGSGRDKSTHERQQSYPEIEKLITSFTLEGQLVVDPFLGSGTTLLAAKNTKRLYFGMDKDKKAVELALRRLADG